ncbi:hypothetical protein, partial [Actinokineospora iranica]|uniref:hypothetical protein n=1 Tax=Actinokineospora iranica TaxID=1271860 RepID=UPI001E65DDFE
QPTINLGALTANTDQGEQPQAPGETPQESAGPGALAPETGHLDNTCATGGHQRSDGSRSAQVWACGEAGPSDSRSPSNSSVQIFRNVDAAEFDSIVESGGRFATGAGQMEGKWFALSGSHAERWGALLNRGAGITIETRIPRSLFEQLHHHPGKLDGVGPGVYANVEQFEMINRFMDGIRVWP